MGLLRQLKTASLSEARHKPGQKKRAAGTFGRFTLLYRRFVPQWLRTVAVIFVCCALSLVWMTTTSLPSQAWIGLPFATFFPMVVGGMCHAWPSRTPPWRTIAWSWVLSFSAAAGLYMTWHVDWTLYAAIAVVVLVGALRINANGRKVWNRVVRARLRRAFGERAAAHI